MKHLIFLIVMLWYGSANAFPPGFISAATATLSIVSGVTISDNFSSDTSSNYTAITSQGMYISGGVANGGNDNGLSYADHILYHKTSVGSSNQYAEASTKDARSGVVIRCNGTTGYIVRISSYGSTSYATLYSFNGSSITNTGKAFSSTVQLQEDTFYKIKATVSSSTFHFYVDVNGDGDYGDTNEDWGTVTDNTYSTGEYTGLFFTEYTGNAVADNFAAGSL